MIISTVTGNVGKDAELRNAGGTSVCKFSIASEARVKNEKVTTWVGCDIWGKRGEALVRHITKGSKVTVVGEQTQREHDGKHYIDIRVDQIALQGGNRTEQRAPASSGGGFEDVPDEGAPNPRNLRSTPVDDYGPESDASEIDAEANAADDDIPF